MMDTIERWVTFALAHANLLSILLGGLCAYVLTLALERYFLPVAQSPEQARHQKGITFLFCWLIAGTAQTLLWGVLTTDPLKLRAVVSFVTGVLVFPLYPALAQVLTDKFPSLGSAWRRIEQ